MAAGVADDVTLFVRVGNRLVTDSGKGKSLGVDPQSMFARVVDDHGAVGNGAIEQLMGCHGGRGGAEVGAADNQLVFGMAGGEGFDFLDQGVGIVRRNAELGRRKIDAMQHHGAEPHVRMGIGNAGNYGFAVQVNHFRLGLPPR